MKYTIALYSLLAVASAASLANRTPESADVVARHESHSHMGHGKNGTEDEPGLEKRRRRCRNRCPARVNTTSDATALLNLNVGVLVAGVAGAGVGAVFLY
ncbi:hypothetical protein F5144DRAFT_575962 [Chaetomium tenue]|uniref:Uncharacterized protein n=1 Tax=Chaetomium tenue TaxID=1854479 RepID=A0ACB7P0W1_9PEZI|nr:hypothetical protein F5144DRAFT_575962 [Chaetomium globosum]